MGIEFFKAGGNDCNYYRHHSAFMILIFVTDVIFVVT